MASARFVMVVVAPFSPYVLNRVACWLSYSETLLEYLLGLLEKLVECNVHN